MKIQNLRELLLLSKVKNYNAAAEQLFISQPTLSRHIKEVEEELGVPLFKRSTRNVECTDYGLFFIPYAQKIVAAEDEYLQGIANMREASDNTIFIGAISSMDLEITDIVYAYNAINPKARFNICPGESEDLIQELIEGNLDFIFIREIPSYDFPNLERIPFSAATLKILMSNSHPLAGKKEVHIEELRGESFLMSEASSLAYRLTTKAAQNAGVELNIIFQGRKTQLINLVRRGAGITALFTNPLDTSYNDISAATLIPPIYAEINCIYNPDSPKAKKHSDFIKFIKTHSNQ